MRLRLLVATVLLAGCTQPTEPAPPAGPSVLPPTLVVDHLTPKERAEREPQGSTPDRAALQVYVRARQGNVRYDFINLTEHNDFEPDLAWHSTTDSHAHVYAVDLALRGPAANLSVEVVEGLTHYAWQARLVLNLTADPPTLLVAALEEHGRFAEPREAGLPFEKLLPRAEEER